MSIGDAANFLGVSERALRYYEELGLVTPCARTPGGMRRYSEEELSRVGRIRELQALLGLNLDEVAVVLRNEDRLSEIKESYHDSRKGARERADLLREALTVQENLRATVEAKRGALDKFLVDLDARIERVKQRLAAAEADVKG
jgi:MerR family transcriptional regulator, repressor of the yfmOP operon